MNYIIYYTESGVHLAHHGVKGMRWGVRRQRNNVSVGRRSGQSSGSPRSQKENEQRRAQRKAKAKKAAKVGAVVVGTALAAYGTYRLAKYMQIRRSVSTVAKAQKYLNDNFMRNVGQTKWKDGRFQMDFVNGRGDKVMSYGRGRMNTGKAVGKQNARVVAEARRMQREGTNTRLDRGLSRVVNAGDRVGAARDAAKNGIKSAGTRAKINTKAAGARAADSFDSIKSKPHNSKLATNIRNKAAAQEFASANQRAAKYGQKAYQRSKDSARNAGERFTRDFATELDRFEAESARYRGIENADRLASGSTKDAIKYLYKNRRR